MRKRWTSLLLGLVVSVAALYFLLRRDLSEVQAEFERANYWYVLPCLVVSVVGLWLRGLRWRVLLNGRVGLSHSFHILNVSYFINGVLPLRVGELARVVLAARLQPPVRVLTSFSTILVERLLDTLAVFALVGITLALNPASLEIGVVGMLLGAGAVVGVVVLVIFAARPAWAHALLALGARVLPPLRRPVVRGWLDSLLDGIKPLAAPRLAVQAVLWTAAGWAASVVAGYVILFAIFDEPTWVASLAMVALASFVIAVPAIPGNLGPFEASVAFGVAWAGLTDDPSDAPAVAFAILLHIVNLATYITMGLVGLWAEDVGLGEIVRAAQNLGRRPDITSPNPLPLAAPAAVVDGVDTRPMTATAATNDGSSK